MNSVQIGGQRYELTGLGSRWVGQFLDGLIYVVMFFTPALVLGIMGVESEFAIIGLVPALFYLLFQDAMEGGQSLGKKALGASVVDASTGAPCSWGQSFVRNISLILLGFIDWLFIFGARQQRLGDKLANTCVINRR